MEWYENGFWNVYPHISTAKQYLLDGYIPKDHTPPLNGVTRIENGIHIIKDTHHHTENRAITLDQFKEMDIDIVIASIPQHTKPFKELISKYKPAAKFVFQMGNMFHEITNNLHEIPNLLASTISIPVPPTCNAVFYHQEFELDIFKPLHQPPEKKIISFINCLPQTKHAVDYYSLKAEMPEYEFRSYGGSCDDGVISGIDKIALIMNRSTYGFHAKYMGDGFGHVLYSWYACGKPVITHLSNYKGKLGEELLIPNETCFDLDTLTVPQVGNMIRNISNAKYQVMCQTARDRFTSCVDYDSEEIKIRKFMENLR